MPPHPSSERSTQNQIRYYWKHNLHGSCWPDKFGQSLYFQHWQETPGVCFGNDDVCGSAYVCRQISACIFRGENFFFYNSGKCGYCSYAALVETGRMTVNDMWQQWYWLRKDQLVTSIALTLNPLSQHWSAHIKQPFLLSLHLTNATQRAFTSIMHEKRSIIGLLCHSSCGLFFIA